MLDIRKLQIDIRSLGEKFLLCDIVPAFEYKDGKKTDTQTGYRYSCALPAHNLEKISVRIDGKKQLEMPADYAEVAFQDLVLTLYMSDGKPMVSGRATSVQLVGKKQP